MTKISLLWYHHHSILFFTSLFLLKKTSSSKSDDQNDDKPPSRPRSAKRKIKSSEASDSSDDRDENWCPANSDSNSESGYTSYQKKIKRLKDRNALSRFRTKESLRQKERWRSMSAEKRAEHNAKAKIRMQRTRDKRKKLLEEKKRLRSNATLDAEGRSGCCPALF